MNHVIKELTVDSQVLRFVAQVILFVFRAIFCIIWKKTFIQIQDTFEKVQCRNSSSARTRTMSNKEGEKRMNKDCDGLVDCLR